jgi:hypothetical protein
VVAIPQRPRPTTQQDPATSMEPDTSEVALKSSRLDEAGPV